MSSKAIAARAAPPSLPIPARRLGGRQGHTAERLTAAAVELVGEVGYRDLTIRQVAKRAGVSAATAYTYFASKDHLLTELFRQRLVGSAGHPPDRRRRAADRAAAVLGDLAVLVAGEPELAAACTVAMFSTDDDVRHLRNLIGAELHRRLLEALDDDIDPAVVQALELAVTGAMVQAGLGHLSYWELPGLLARTAELLLGSRGGT